MGIDALEVSQVRADPRISEPESKRFSMAYSRRTRRLVLWLFISACILGALTFLAWGYYGEDRFQVKGYFLTIHVDCAGDQPVVFACSASFRREQSQALANNIDQYSFTRIKKSRPWGNNMDEMLSDPFDGQPVKMETRYYFGTSLFGRTVSWSQSNFMTVYAEWADGRKLCKVVEIPDARASHEVRVQLP